MDFNLAVMLQESARRAPGKPAVILRETSTSYAQLDAESDRVAAALTAAGLAAGDPVGLQLPNIPEFVLAYFGILKAGGVVVPMNVLLKAAEIEFQLRDSGARTLINRKTNLRHMMGDHHGRSARWATLLVRAVDGILGTHSVQQPARLRMRLRAGWPNSPVR